MANQDDYIIKITLDLKNDAALRQLIAELEEAGRKVPKGAKAIEGAMNSAGKSSKRFGSSVQNASYQMTDFVVQVQGGVDPIRALSMQLPQLLGGFGALGAGIGLVTSLLPTLISLMGESTGAAKEATEAWDEYTAALKRFEETGKIVDQILASMSGDKAIKARSEAIAQFRAEAEKLGKINQVGSARTAAIEGIFGSPAEFEKYNKIISEMNDKNLDETATKLLQLSSGMQGFASPDTIKRIEELAKSLRELSYSTSGPAKPSAAAQAAIDANDWLQVLEQIKDAEFEALQAAEAADEARAEKLRKEAEAARRKLTATLQPVRANQGDPELNERFLKFQKEYNAELDKTKQVYSELYPAAAAYQEQFQKLEYAKEKGIITETEYVKRLGEATKAYEESLEGFSAADEILKTFDQSFNTMLDGVLMGTQDIAEGFKDMAKVIIAQVLKIMAYQAIIGAFGGPTGTGFGATFAKAVGMNAKGNAFSNGNVIPFAKGGIVSSPTLFPMKNGAGLMGEAGPEMVAPIRRLSNGDLGVGASPVNVTVNNMASGVKVNARQTEGGLTLDVVLDQIGAAIAKGGNPVANALESSYSLGRGRAVY